MVKKYYRINQYIRAQSLRVIGEDGKQIGILPQDEALNLAREKGLDLVEIAPAANPPVAKIVNLKKFIYQEEKREREVKKKARGGELKGIRLSPFIAKADLEVRIRKAEQFLREGNKVRIAVRFMGRQLGKREFGYEVLKKVTETLANFARTEGEPKWFGRDLVLIISPVKHSERGKNEEKDEIQSQEISQEKV